MGDQGKGFEGISENYRHACFPRIVDLFAVYLLKRKLIDTGVQLNHRWFKSERVIERLPEFDKREEIISKMIQLELACEDLTYGSSRSEERIRKVVELFRELEEKLK